MATTKALSALERASLLDDLQRLRSDADLLDASGLLERFLPLPAHERALSRDVLVVRGERGAGKTMLFKTLNALKSRSLRTVDLFPRADDDDNAAWVEGFSERGTLHPHAEMIARFAATATPEQLRVMWMGHLVGRIASEVLLEGLPAPTAFMHAWQNTNNVAEWSAAAESSLSMLTTWLDAVHRRLEASNREVVVLYDHLDKIGTTSPSLREKATSSLLALWLSLSNRYRCVRAKIFVREDLFDASLSASADASKLRARSVALNWDVNSLYRLLIRHMTALSPAMRSWIEDTVNAIPLTLRSPYGWFPPDPLKELGRPSHAAFVEHLAGAQMGRGVKKGFVYNWIPNRLQDARGAIVPRSILNLIAYAADHGRHAPKAKYKRLLHPYDLQAALEQTSLQRVAEIGEEQVVVYRLEALNGIVVPVDHAVLAKKLAQPSTHDDSFARDGSEVVAELGRIGVLRDRGGGRWDVPDIYRYGYGIKRRGGPPRPV